MNRNLSIPDPRGLAAPPTRRWGWARWPSGLLWMGTCVAATYLAMSYDFKPGRLGPRRTSWPTETDYSYSTAFVRHPGQTAILAFLHPRCVCTRATVKQLLKTAEAHPTAAVIVPVFVPVGPHDAAAWEESEYVKTIQTELPAAQVLFDPGGIQAWRFGALTSGTVLVYDQAGHEVFRGGITDRRGGERDNPGLRRLALALAGEPLAEAAPPPVFGCPLVAPNTPDEREEGTDALTAR